MLYIDQLKRDFNELRVKTNEGIYYMHEVLDARGFEVIDDCTGEKPVLLLYDYLNSTVHTELGSSLEECIRNIEDTELLQEHSLSDDAVVYKIINNNNK